MQSSIEYFTKGAMITFSGRITADDIFAANKSLLEHPDFTNHSFAIWDYEAVEHITFERSQIESLATKDNFDSWKNPDRKIAVVSPSPLIFGLARMYEAHYGEGPWKIKVFYDRKKALAWVNLPYNAD